MTFDILFLVMAILAFGFAGYKFLKTKKKPEIVSAFDALKIEYNKQVRTLKDLDEKHQMIINNMNYVDNDSIQMTDLFKEIEVIKQEKEACRQRVSFFLSQLRRMEVRK